MLARRALALAAALLAGCPDGPGPGGGGLAPAQSLAEFCARAPAAAAAKYAECYGGPKDAYQAFFQRALDCARDQDAVSGGLVAFNAVAATACLADVAAAPCAAVGKLVPSCAAVLVGQVAAGGACSRDQECAPGTSCRLPAGGCSGSCILEAALADSCSDRECGGELWCDAGRICRAPSALDGPCGECQEGLYCAYPAETCAAHKAAGTPCAQSQECQAGLICAGPDGARACRAYKKVGEACTSGHRECRLGYCPGAGVCTLATAGLPCGAEGTRRSICDFDAWCDAGGACREPQAQGGSCTHPSQCASYDCQSDLCQPRRCP